MGMGGQPHSPAASTPNKVPVPIVQEADWDPGPVWKGGKSRHHRNSIPDRVAIPTELPGPRTKCKCSNILSVVNFRTRSSPFSEKKSTLACGAVCVSTDRHKLHKNVTN
jgi:hypothetical protein